MKVTASVEDGILTYRNEIGKPVFVCTVDYALEVLRRSMEDDDE